MDESTVARTRTPPTMVTIGNRQIISTGRWNDIVMADYIFANGQRSIEVGELARRAYGHNDKNTRAKVRRYLHKIFAMLIDRGFFMVTDHDNRNRALAVKVLDPNSEVDVQHAIEKLDRMKKRRELSVERYERAIGLLKPAGE